MKSLMFGILAMVGIQPVSSASATVVPGASAPKVTQEEAPPKLGGYQEMDLKSTGNV